ncbi:hypothetical protein DFH06DRAFT_1348012 [Mycena polygramma]|nr:hypothetical protein DFH06DRAFT_1348012 [Mycena polygramma]
MCAHNGDHAAALLLRAVLAWINADHASPVVRQVYRDRKRLVQAPRPCRADAALAHGGGGDFEEAWRAPSSRLLYIFVGGGSEINEWRARARVPPLATPVRADAYEVVLRAETEDFDLLEEGLELEEEEDEMQQEDTKNTRNGNDSPVVGTMPHFARESVAAFHSAASTAVCQQQFSAPLPFEASPSSPASSASGGWDGPATPPASAAPMHGMMLSQTCAHAHRLAPLHTSVRKMDSEPYFDATPRSAGATYDLGLGFDGAESVLLGGGAGIGMHAEMRAGAAVHNTIRPREVHEHHQHMRVAGAEMAEASRMGMGGTRMGMQMGVAAGQSCTRRRALLERLAVAARPAAIPLAALPLPGSL